MTPTIALWAERRDNTGRGYVEEIGQLIHLDYGPHYYEETIVAALEKRLKLLEPGIILTRIKEPDRG